MNIENINIGDVIWAKRYKTKKEKLKIKENHQEGPYIIIKKTKCRIYALACTSNKNNKTPKHHLGKINDNSIKETYILLDKIHLINKHNYIKTIGPLPKTKVNTIKKALYLETKNHKINLLTQKDIKFTHNIGDLITYKNNLYYIFKLTKDNLFCYQFHKGKSKNKFQIQNINYTFNYNNEIKINPKSRYKLSAIAEENTIQKINDHIDKLNKQVNSFKGNLVTQNQNIYYIYEEYKDHYNAIKLHEITFDNAYPIKLQNKTYYTDFININLKKPNTFTTIKNVSKKDILKIEKQQQNIKKAKQKKKIQKSTNLEKGNVLCNENDERYLIVKKQEDSITLFSLKDYQTCLTYQIDTLKKQKYQNTKKLDNLSYMNAIIQYNKRLTS